MIKLNYKFKFLPNILWEKLEVRQNDLAFFIHNIYIPYQIGTLYVSIYQTFSTSNFVFEFIYLSLKNYWKFRIKKLTNNDKNAMEQFVLYINTFQLITR